jgi:hypothetical protein
MALDEAIQNSVVFKQPRSVSRIFDKGGEIPDWLHRNRNELEDDYCKLFGQLISFWTKTTPTLVTSNHCLRRTNWALSGSSLDSIVHAAIIEEARVTKYRRSLLESCTPAVVLREEIAVLFGTMAKKGPVVVKTAKNGKSVVIWEWQFPDGITDVQTASNEAFSMKNLTGGLERRIADRNLLVDAISKIENLPFASVDPYQQNVLPHRIHTLLTLLVKELSINWKVHEKFPADWG